MNRPVHLAIILGALLGTVPVQAEPTPALPFWSRPFPTGYVQRLPEAEYVPARRTRCMSRRRVHSAEGGWELVERPCSDPIHARD